MKFYQFLTILICYIHVILLNSLTVQSADPPFVLNITSSAGTSCEKAAPSINPSAGDQLSLANKERCIVGEPYERFSLTCQPTPTLTPDLVVAWFINNTLVKSNDLIYTDQHSLVFKTLNVTDRGKYECRIVQSNQLNGQPQAQGVINVEVLPYVLGSRKEVTAIEENAINLTCVVTSKIQTKVIWKVVTDSVNATLHGSEGRIKLESPEIVITNTMLIIPQANISLDRGTYTCWAESEFGTSVRNMTFFVRVKSKYAALWPFLGICLEVLILCIIILIYEKKRDKTELEESDTDQGPETKSSPDHGQDNVRYRK